MSIYLYDASALIYTGERGAENTKYAQMLSNKVHGLPLAGVRYALKMILSNVVTNGSNTNIVVFDPEKCDKASLYPGYKECRNFDSNIHVQKLILKDILDNLGIPTLKRENYEADDLIYTICVNVYIKKNILSSYDDCTIYADDLDILQAMVYPKIRRLSCKSDGSIVNCDNFVHSAHKDVPIIYNETGACLMFMGKPSNNMKAMKNGKDLYRSYHEWISKQSDVGQGLRGSKENVSRFIKELYVRDPVTNTEVATEFLKRAEVIFPRYYEGEFDFRTKKVKDPKLASEVFSVLSMSQGADLFGIPMVSGQTVFPYFDKWYRYYASGRASADVGFPEDIVAVDEGLLVEDVGGF